ncbi:MAG: GNAT family N-acetyltransferase [Acidimicrobiales bacterium]
MRRPVPIPDRFETERLRLRAMTIDDVDLLTTLNSDDEVMRHLTGRASTSDESAQELASSLGTRWLLFGYDDGDFHGWVAATPVDPNGEFDLGWRLRRSAWGQGFACEAASSLVDHLFAAGATRLIAQTMAVNERSRAVMDRLGLVHARTFHLDVEDPLPGTELGEVEYELTRATWEQRS